jgi:hypothetical protein
METEMFRVVGGRGGQTERFDGAYREKGGQTERLDGAVRERETDRRRGFTERIEIEADRRRGLVKLVVVFRNFTKAPEHYNFPYSSESSKPVTSAGKVKGNKLKVSITF